MKFSFIESVTPDLLEGIRASWMSQTENDELGASVFRYEQDLAYFGRVLDGTANAGPCILSGVRDDATQECRALITVSHNKPKSASSYLKALDLTLEPALAASDASESAALLGWVIATAMVGCLGLASTGMPAKEVKFFLNRPAERDILLAATTAVLSDPNFAAHWAVSGHKSWIVVTRKPVQSLLAAV